MQDSTTSNVACLDGAFSSAKVFGRHFIIKQIAEVNLKRIQDNLVGGKKNSYIAGRHSRVRNNIPVACVIVVSTAQSR